MHVHLAVTRPESRQRRTLLHLTPHRLIILALLQVKSDMEAEAEMEWQRHAMPWHGVTLATQFLSCKRHKQERFLQAKMCCSRFKASHACRKPWQLGMMP
jgi:hypothetical protein